MGLRVGVEEGQAMILSLETLLPSRNSRFLTQINRIEPLAGVENSILKSDPVP
jgi:hypothetical protein